MKTDLPSKTAMSFAFAAITLFSCSKESDSPFPGNVTSNEPASAATIGNIVDYGQVNSNTRLMRTDLSIQNYNLYGTDGELSSAPAKVEVAFYVNEDGLIPPGEYTFTSSETKSPFTFDSGTFILDSEGNTYKTPISDGMILVNKEGDNYVFEMQVGLESGMTFSKRYTGPMTYADVSVK
jgi:hypothetical protein